MFTALQRLDLYGVIWTTNFVAQHPWLHPVVYVLAQVLLIVYPIALYILWQMPHKTARFGARKAVMLALMALVAVIAVKGFVSFIWIRPRPFIADPWLSYMPFNVDPPSFPSGHAMMSMAMAASIYFSGYKKLGFWLIIASILIGIGRVASGVHYPLDVIAGLLIGVAVAWGLHSEASTIRHYLPDR